MLFGGAAEQGELFAPVGRFVADGLEHVVPDGVCGPGVPLLAEVEAVGRHVSEVIQSVRLPRKDKIPQKRLVHNGEVVAIEFVQIGDLLGDLLPFFDDAKVLQSHLVVPKPEYARAFEVMRRLALAWHSLQLVENLHRCNKAQYR